MSKKHIPLGQIVGTHGIAGWLKLKLFNPSSKVLLSAPRIRLTHGSDSVSCTLDQAKPHKRLVLLKLKGIDRIETAEKFIGDELSVPENALEALEHDQYYYRDVVGFDVFDTKETYLGKITRVWFKEGGDLYVVGGENKEYLIPAAKEFIEKVDLPNQRMIVDLPEGILDL